ncbi:hypothetical protein GCM10010873_30100 [Cypionkella aquatica]|uniref:DUF2256 domain-containing protein n=1 Tax=Cypionkella aquatica TaxID=1756042 RepID=A0AA37U3Y8_9RHOB|nr:DUF2256 domain-containing protein [Cypionkella aquatica]GLS88036.1 hypothetical protein GCM10010873_30100 [Cypionkella aquatica]
MTKMRRKADLPVKICASCGRPMVWRKAWEKVWDEVKYCSDRCRKTKVKAAGKIKAAADHAQP